MRVSHALASSANTTRRRCNRSEGPRGSGAQTTAALRGEHVQRWSRWTVVQGSPQPARGVRNTGEQAILVGPEHTGGAYIGFVGPA